MADRLRSARHLSAALWVGGGGAVVVAVAALFRGRIPFAALVAAQIAGAVIAYLAPQLVTRARDREVERLRTALEELRAQTMVTLGDTLDPLILGLARLAQASTKDQRAPLAAELEAGILGAAARLLGPAERTRACWFVLRQEPEQPPRLEPERHHGRVDEPATVFVGGTPAGDDLLDSLAQRVPFRCDDVEEDPPPGWDPSRAREYRSFLAVPVLAGAELYGMLTVDSPTIAAFTVDDVPVFQTLADLFAVVRAAT